MNPPPSLSIMIVEIAPSTETTISLIPCAAYATNSGDLEVGQRAQLILQENLLISYDNLAAYGVNIDNKNITAQNSTMIKGEDNVFRFKVQGTT